MRTEEEILQKIHEARKTITEYKRRNEFEGCLRWSEFANALEWVLQPSENEEDEPKCSGDVELAFSEQGRKEP